ncbi:MAG: hypothetical protein HOV67_25410, partial [Kribbellaceae bacterium]|nr:hypothetical protein [Kribbellaceae bacterium]
PTGSLHIVDLPSPEALHRFVYEEPYYLGGAFASVEVYRFENLTGRTMWDFATPVADYDRFLVLTTDAPRAVTSDHLIVYGNLYDDAGEVGRAGLVEAPSAEAARVLLESADAEVHPWEFGGRR